MPRLHILSVGYERKWMESRTQILRSAGYRVDEVNNLKAALALAESDSVDMLVICDSVPRPEQQWLIARVRERRRMLPILCIGDYPYVSAADCCLGVENTPVALLNAVKLAATPGHGVQPPPQ